mgnify:CR=1 FL=1
MSEFPEGRSPYGLYQMTGNVTEWCQDPWEYAAYERYRHGDLRAPEGDRNLRQMTLRGGSWAPDSPAAYRCTHRGILGPEALNACIGFRCARDA